MHVLQRNVSSRSLLRRLTIYEFLFLKETPRRARHRFHNMSSSQHETLRRPPMFKKPSAEIVTMTTSRESRAREAYKKDGHTSTSPHLTPRILSSSLLFVLHPLSWSSAAASDCNGAEATRRCRSWGGVLRWSLSLRYVLYTLLLFPSSTLPCSGPCAPCKTLLLHAGVAYYGWRVFLCLSRGVGGKKKRGGRRY
jgi:hypothetical protein